MSLTDSRTCESRICCVWISNVIGVLGNMIYHASYQVGTYFPIFLPVYRMVSFLQNLSPRCNQILPRSSFIHNGVIRGIHWMHPINSKYCNSWLQAKSNTNPSLITFVG
jgi:hypothetical protein